MPQECIAEKYLRALYGNSVGIGKMGKIKGVKDKDLARHLVKDEVFRTNIIIGVYLTATTVWWKELENARY